MYGVIRIFSFDIRAIKNLFFKKTLLIKHHLIKTTVVTVRSINILIILRILYFLKVIL